MTREERNEITKHRWHYDHEYRERESKRRRMKRVRERVRLAEERFKRHVEACAEDTEEPESKQAAVLVDGRLVECEVYNAAFLGKEVGCTARVVREWLSGGVLPGCSAWMSGGRTWGNLQPMFSSDFIGAVREAHIQVFQLDGRRPRTTLRRLIKEALTERGVHYVTLEEMADGKRFEETEDGKE